LGKKLLADKPAAMTPSLITKGAFPSGKDKKKKGLQKELTLEERL
jgi:hypothetical protein